MLICTPPGYHDMGPSELRKLEYPPYMWLRVAHVCRYWRSIALSYPALFTYVRISRSYAIVEEWLAHSGASPIYIIGMLNEYRRHWEQIVPHLSHTVDVNITLPSAMSESKPVSWPNCPLMKTVACTLSQDEDIPQGVSVLDTFLRCLPNLEHLTIRAEVSQARWARATIPQSLRQLEVNSWAFSEHDDLEDLVSTLDRLPNLQVLELRNLLWKLSDESTPPLLVPCIPSLKLSGHITPVTAIARSITCLNRLRISVEAIAGDLNENFSLFKTFFRVLSSSHQDLFKSLREVNLEVGSSELCRTLYVVNLKGWTSRAADGDMPLVDLSVHTDEREWTHTLMETLSDAFYPLLDHLECLNVILSPVEFDIDDVAFAASCCRQLNSLRFLKLSMERSLLYAFMSSIGSLHGDLMFPDLQSIYIMCHSLRGFSVGHVLRTREVLSRRKRRGGKQLDCLILVAVEARFGWMSREIEEELGVLKEMVGVLTVLGTEEEDSDEE